MNDRAVVDTLLRSSEPSIRWKARVHVLGEDPDSKAVWSLRDEIRRSPRVQALLSRRDQLSHAATLQTVYQKWQGLHWVLASLADIGYPEGDTTLHALRDRVLEVWLGAGSSESSRLEPRRPRTGNGASPSWRAVTDGAGPNRETPCTS